MKIERFEDLEIWQDSRELCQMIYKITSVKPFCDDYKFRDQIRAAGGSMVEWFLFDVRRLTFGAQVAEPACPDPLGSK